jgi:hypothetical protein
VDLSQVNGTGLNGRITKNDVLNYVSSGQKSQVKSQPMVNRPSSIVAPAEGDQLIKHSTMRKSIAQHMVESKHTSPHVLTVMEADMSRVSKHRAANKAAFERDGVNLTFTAYFMMAIVAGLKAYPQTNSSWTDEGLLVHKNVNLGMAVSLGEDGLIVPVIKKRKTCPCWRWRVQSMTSPIVPAQRNSNRMKSKAARSLDQSRRERIAIRLPGYQPAAGGHPRCGSDAKTRGRHRRCDCHPPDGVHVLRLRSPHPGRCIRGLVFGKGQRYVGELELGVSERRRKSPFSFA